MGRSAEERTKWIEELGLVLSTVRTNMEKLILLFKNQLATSLFPQYEEMFDLEKLTVHCSLMCCDLRSGLGERIHARSERFLRQSLEDFPLEAAV